MENIFVYLYICIYNFMYTFSHTTIRKKMNTTQDVDVKRCPEKAMKLKINSDCTKYCCYVFI